MGPLDFLIEQRDDCIADDCPVSAQAYQDCIDEITTLRARLRRAEVECEAWRSGNLYWDGCAECSDVVDGDGNHYDTIDAAVDALMGEAKDAE